MLKERESSHMSFGDQNAADRLSRASVARLMEHMNRHAQRRFDMSKCSSGVQVCKLVENCSQCFHAVQPILSGYTLNDPPTGTSFVRLDVTKEDINKHWISYPLLAHPVIEHLLKWASYSNKPASTEAMENLRRKIVDRITNADDRNRHYFTLARAVFCAPGYHSTGPGIWTVARQPFNAAEARQSKIDVRIGETVLWDQRFYISLRTPTPSDPNYTYFGMTPAKLNFVVRPYTASDHFSIIGRMRSAPKSDWSHAIQHALKHYWRKMPEAVRDTIPCVALKQDNGNDSYVVAVPSVGVNLESALMDVKISFNAHSKLERAGKVVGFRLLREADVI